MRPPGTCGSHSCAPHTQPGMCPLTPTASAPLCAGWLPLRPPRQRCPPPPAAQCAAQVPGHSAQGARQQRTCLVLICIIKVGRRGYDPFSMGEAIGHSHKGMRGGWPSPGKRCCVHPGCARWAGCEMRTAQEAQRARPNSCGMKKVEGRSDFFPPLVLAALDPLAHVSLARVSCACYARRSLRGS